MLICYILILFHTRIEKKWSGHQFLHTHAVMMDADLVATSQDFFIALSKVYLFIYFFIYFESTFKSIFGTPSNVRMSLNTLYPW